MPLMLICRTLCCLLSVAVHCYVSAAEVSAKPPNVVLVMADDLGFSDLGCYGSEIETPNLDLLADQGVRFSQFYNTAKCHSSRVSLLTGRWCHQAGDTRLTHAVTIPEVLAPAGYFTAMTGKWHLSGQPTDFGFQKYFGHLSGACNYYKGDNTFRLNGETWKVPAQGFYTTVANVDRAIEFLGEARTEHKPFFLYVAFNAPHSPLQPLEADYKKYLGRYEVGWDSIRAARVAKQKSLGLFGNSIAESPRPDHVPAWEALAPETQDWEARRMAAYAALVDRVDQELGRLISDLKAHDEFDNTIFVFCSDNGACPYDRRKPEPELAPFDPDTLWSDSTGWAWTRNSPFRFYKQNQYEGGIGSPAIVSWPAGLKVNPGSIIHTPAHIVDLLPTIAEATGAKVPESWTGRDLRPLAGVSLLPILRGEQLASRPPIHLLFSRDRGLRDGDWKIVSFQSGNWELYNLAEDRTEIRDLAADEPDRLKQMVAQWHELAANVLHAPKREHEVLDPRNSKTKVHNEWTRYTRTPDGLFQAAGFSNPDGTSRRSDKLIEERIRGRIGTKYRIEGKQLILECSGTDPGLAFQGLQIENAVGPYTLSFRMQSRATGGAEIYWTTDAKTILPKGKHLDFDVQHDGMWHDLVVAIPESKAIHALRLDPCAGVGTVRLESIQLRDASGTVVRQWP
jgi:arylsulfatase A-like enzyme